MSHHSSTLSFQNEYAILKKAAETKAKHLPHLVEVFIGANHVALSI